MSGGTETTTGYFVATDGQAYENFMGRWSSRLAPLFLELLAQCSENTFVVPTSAEGRMALDHSV